VAEQVIIVVEKRVVGVCAIVLAAALVDEEMVDESVAELEIIMVGKGVVIGVYAIALGEESVDVEKAVIMLGMADEMIVEVCVDV
jgi:hypothetical protein